MPVSYTHLWVDMSVNPEDHYWWGDLDTATYSKLESALCEEIAKPNFSSRAEDYMKLDTYKRYKAYLCENADYIDVYKRQVFVPSICPDGQTSH